MKKQTVLLLLFWSMIVTMATPLLTAGAISHTNDWLQLRFGYPFPFIEQTLGAASSQPPAHYLAVLHIREHPSRLLVGPFFVSLLCIFSVLSSLSGCWLELRRLKRKS